MRLDLPQRFGLAVVVPDFDLPTAKARAVLPSGYSRADAVFNVQRASLLIAALATGSTWAFPAALEDRFHQPYRAPLVPGLDDILKLRAPGLLGCALSGAGPPSWSSSSAATNPSATWCGRSSNCTATNPRPFSPISRSADFRWSETA